MISYRYHVTTLVAVFLALAVGVALGGGPLSDLGRGDSAPSASQAPTRAASEVRAAEYGDTFALAGADTLYAGRLEDHAVSLLVMPGADGDVVSALGAQVEAAGGTVAGRYDAQASLVAAGEKQLVDTLGSQLMTQLKSDTVAADAPTYERLGQLLAIALGVTGAPNPDIASVRQSLSAAELLTPPKTARAADLVLVVLGDDVDDAILTGLVTGLAASSGGPDGSAGPAGSVAVVVAGDTASGASGDLRALRGEPVADQVATVDGDDTPIGQVSVALALARSLSVPGGSYGPSGADGAVPLG